MSAARRRDSSSSKVAWLTLKATCQEPPFSAKIALVHFVGFGVGELEERQRAAVAHFEEGVAVIHVAAEFRAEAALAPGGDERDAEDVLDEGAIDLLVLHREGVVVQALRWLGEQGGAGAVD